MDATSAQRASAFRFIVALGFVSLFADMTYEGAHSIIGPLLKDLGATATQVGFIAGLGEMIAASLRFFSGRLADRTRAYWTITTLGYFLNLVVVPGLAFAGNWQAAALLVIAERTGKSLRGPARDVLLSKRQRSSDTDQGSEFMPRWTRRVRYWGRSWWLRPLPGIIVSALLSCGWGFRLSALSWLCSLHVRLVPAKAHRHHPRSNRSFRKCSGFMWLRPACSPWDLSTSRCSLITFKKTALTKPEVIPLLYSGAMGMNGLTALLLGRLFDTYGIQILTFGTLLSLLALPFGFL